MFVFQAIIGFPPFPKTLILMQKGGFMLSLLMQKGITPKRTLWGSIIGIFVFIAGFVLMKFSIVLIIFLIAGTFVGYIAGAIIGTGIGVSGVVSSDGKGRKGTFMFGIIGSIIGTLITLNFFY
jgi:hypothetical protein